VAAAAVAERRSTIASILQDDQVREGRADVMSTSASLNPIELLRDQIQGASPDVLQAMIKTFAQTLMSVEPAAVEVAGLGDGITGRARRPGAAPR
jgi:hypothetical protein